MAKVDLFPSIDIEQRKKGISSACNQCDARTVAAKARGYKMSNHHSKLISAALAVTVMATASIAAAGHGMKSMGGMSGMSDMKTPSGGMAASDGASGGSMGDMSAMMKNMGDMMQMMSGMREKRGAMDHQGFHGSAHVGDVSKFDADGDGDVSPEELQSGLTEELKTFDQDANGALSLAEFETLHAARIRHAMVDHFQHLDEDGDGSVTQSEMTAPAKMMMRAHAAAKPAPDPE